MTDLNTEWVTLQADGKEMQAYVACPVEGKHPAVILWMEIFGINQHIQDVAQRLSKEGYLVIAPDYFHRVAPGIMLDYNAAGVEEGKRYKDQVTHAHMLADAQAVLGYVKQHPQADPKDKVGSIGFCFGGYAAYVAATLPQVAATVSFYGTGIANGLPNTEEPPADMTEDIKGVIECFFGAQDDSIPEADIELIEQSLEMAKVVSNVKVFEDADHGFFCDARGSYNAEAALETWQDVLKLFQKVLKPVPVNS